MQEQVKRMRALRIPPELPHGVGLHAMRKLVAQQLEFPLAHTCCNTEFTTQQMADYYTRAREAALARERLIATVGGQEYPWAPGESAHAFWHGAGKPFERSTPVDLPDSAVVGSASAVRAAGLHVILWSYQKVRNAPEGVELRDAADLLPVEDAERLVEIPGFRLAHLADLVRLKAMAVSERPSWFVDLDVLWMASPAEWVKQLPVEAAGHLFGSAVLAPSRQGTTATAYERLLALNPLVRPRDAVVLQPPFRCPPGSPFPAKALELVGVNVPRIVGEWWGLTTFGRPHARLGQPAPGSQLPYAFFMDAMEKALITVGLQYAVADWFVMAPVHYWMGTRMYKKNGKLPAAEKRTRRSLCVVNYVSSCRPHADTSDEIRQAGSNWWDPESFWAKCVSLSRAAFEEVGVSPSRDEAPIWVCKVEAPLHGDSPPVLGARCQPEPVKQEPVSPQDEPTPKAPRLADPTEESTGGASPGAEAQWPWPSAEMVESMVAFWRLNAKCAACQTMYPDLPVEWQAALHAAKVDHLPPASSAVRKLLAQGVARRCARACTRAHAQAFTRGVCVCVCACILFVCHRNRTLLAQMHASFCM